MLDNLVKALLLPRKGFLKATQVAIVRAPLLVHIKAESPYILEGKSGPLHYYLFPSKLVSTVLGTHFLRCAMHIHFWVSVQNTAEYRQKFKHIFL